MSDWSSTAWTSLVKQSRKVLSRSMLLLISCFALVACDDGYTEPPIRVSSNKWAGFEALYFAESLGYFDPGTVHLVETPVSMGLVQAMRGTTIDAAAMSLARALSFSELGLDITIVLVFDSSQGADVLLARQGIETVAGLRGKRVGAEMDTVNGYLLMRALERADVSPADLTFVDADNEQLPELFENGRIDAASTFGDAEAAVRAAGANQLFSSSDIPGEIIDVLAVRTSVLKSSPRQVTALIAGWIKAQTAIDAWPEDKALPEGSMPEASYRAAIERLHVMTVAENKAFLANDGAQLNRLMIRRKTLSARLALTAADAKLPAVSSRPYEEALSQIQGSRATGDRP